LGGVMKSRPGQLVLNTNRQSDTYTYRSVGAAAAETQESRLPSGLVECCMALSSDTSRDDSNPVSRHIARVAARLFATQGYDATSVREIVEEAGVAKPTLYYYFQNKEGLAKALISGPLSELVDQLGQIVHTEPDAVRCLERVFEAQFAFCREDPERARFLYALMFGPPGSAPAHDFEPCKRDLGRWMEAAVLRLAADGIIAHERVNACVTMCRGLVVITTLDFLYGEKLLNQGAAQALLHDMLRGFDERQSKHITG
jgi:AcrR family transcriptional regulator